MKTRSTRHKRGMVAVTAWACLTVSVWGAQAAETGLIRLVKKIQPAVATVIAYDIERNIENIGTGFFINSKGHLVTNFHVLAGRYAADVRTAEGKSYPVKAVIAENEAADLLKLEVNIPPAEVSWIPMEDRVPDIAERVVVVGSPMGLEQTVSEGIVSSVREIHPVGTVFQMSAPISPGSSGSPVVSMKGQVVGIATFQFVQGQNLNFAVTAGQIMALRKSDTAKTLSEWTFEHLGSKPKVAEALCQKGFSLSLNGENREALEHFKKATEADPQDPAAWSGLGSCYAGLNDPEDAIAAYQQAIAANPKDESSHFHLGMYFDKLGRLDEAIAAYRQAIALSPQFEAAYFNLGLVLCRLGHFDEGRQAFEAVTRINPEAAPAYYNAGIAYSRMSWFEDAVRAQKNVIRLKPDFAPAYFAMGEALCRLGRESEGIGAYKEAIHADPDFAPAHLAMGSAMLKKGDRSGALEEFKILKKLDTDMADTLFKRIYSDDDPVKPPKRNSKQPKS
ncbi:MAG: tetratricopeptide repeat protein [Hyphomicrobiales bacterium]